jgi:hypothetical protein
MIVVVAVAVAVTIHVPTDARGIAKEVAPETARAVLYFQCSERAIDTNNRRRIG